MFGKLGVGILGQRAPHPPSYARLCWLSISVISVSARNAKIPIENYAGVRWRK